ncbi:MAG: hypothetical protein HZA53_10985 [Planctomycetes bacterium]|nr:hypothetical protein [Planctomycetota bacterium]
MSTLAGVLVALYLALGAWLDWPGSWAVRRWIEPERDERSRAVALHASERMRGWREDNERASAGSIVFLGSSTIERMPLDELFPGKPVLNRGIARASTAELQRWLERALPRAAPAAFVVYAGAVDRREDGASDAEVVERVRALLEALRARAPSAAIALLGVLPVRATDPGLFELQQRLGRLAGEFTPAVIFVPTLRPPISSSDGVLSEELSSDPLHMNGAGSRVLARWIVDDGGVAGRLLAP